ncbi:MAG TPA: Calx-beta domain-containing protein [Acidimicrobiales bacterium]|nr:Calx-beta domain-containing protein [Acidimicrobiales bacterium]
MGPAISVGSVAVHEGDAGTRPAMFTVSLSSPSTSTVTVNYATANATATSGDYTAKTGTVSFAPGITSQKVKVPVAGDGNVNPDWPHRAHLIWPHPVSLADRVESGAL